MKTRIIRNRMMMVLFIHSLQTDWSVWSVIVWEEPRRMFVGTAKQNAATDYDEEVTIIHHNIFLALHIIYIYLCFLKVSLLPICIYTPYRGRGGKANLRTSCQCWSHPSWFQKLFTKTKNPSKKTRLGERGGESEGGLAKVPNIAGIFFSTLLLWS